MIKKEKNSCQTCDHFYEFWRTKDCSVWESNWFKATSPYFSMIFLWVKRFLSRTIFFLFLTNWNKVNQGKNVTALFHITFFMSGSNKSVSFLPSLKRYFILRKVRNISGNKKNNKKRVLWSWRIRSTYIYFVKTTLAWLIADR